MRDQVVEVVHKYIDAARHNDPSDLPLHPEVIGEFPTNTYRGADRSSRRWSRSRGS